MLPFKTILFATDFSPTSDVAFGVAGALARDYRARLIVVHVIEPLHVGFNEFGSYVSPEEDRTRARDLLEAIEAPAPRVALEQRLLDGDPAEMIAKAAADTNADLIVLGTHGRSGLTRLVMGSVAEEVLRRAPCPVLTIRGMVKAPVEETVDETEEVPEVLAI
jgi:nucleotide-binding universal stress UspA family protein